MIWFIAIGSAIGGVTRYAVGAFIQQRAGIAFPLGTLVINITGSFLLGFLLRYALATPAISPELRGMLTTGFCGGYTTFSTFTYEAMGLLEDRELGRATAYVLLSVTVSLVAVFAGITLARALLAFRERI